MLEMVEKSGWNILQEAEEHCNILFFEQLYTVSSFFIYLSHVSTLSLSVVRVEVVVEVMVELESVLRTLGIKVREFNLDGKLVYYRTSVIHDHTYEQ